MAKHKESLPLAPREKLDPKKQLEEMLTQNSYFFAFDESGEFIDEGDRSDSLLDPALINGMRKRNQSLVFNSMGMYTFSPCPLEIYSR